MLALPDRYSMEMNDLKDSYRDSVGTRFQIFPFWLLNCTGLGANSTALRTCVVSEVYDYWLKCDVLNSKTGKKMFSVGVNKVDILYNLGPFSGKNRAVLL